MIRFVERALNLRDGEGRLVTSFFVVLAVNAAVLELTDVVATAGFVSNLGVVRVPWLWLVDMLFTLLLATFVATRIDRLPRLRLISWMIGGFSLLYVLLIAMFAAGLPHWVTYTSLYIIADQQFMLFPLVFWVLVNDVFSAAQSKRIVPVIGAGVAVGSIIGNLLPVLTALAIRRPGAETGVDNTYLFVLAIGLLALSLVILRLTFRRREMRVRQSAADDNDLRHALQVGMEYFVRLPLFRYLGISMLLLGVALTMIEFNFLYMIETTLTTSAAFQAFYGAYKAALIVALLAFQGLITGRVLEKTPLKNGYLVLPGALLVASGFAAIFTNLAGAASSRFVARFVERAWDEPVRHATLALVPDERRGRVSTFMDSYFFTVATIAGSALLLFLFWVGADWPPVTIVYAYMMAAMAASAAAVLASRQARAVYDVSLLSWRLARARRKSVLDGIEF